MKQEFRIFTMSCANYIISGIMNTLTSVLAVYYTGDVMMSAGVLGIMFSMGGVLTALAATIPGRVIDKIGAKKGLIITCIMQLIALLGFAMSHSPIMMMIWTSVESVATALSSPCNTQVLAALKVENPAKLLRANSLGSSLATLLASSTGALLVERYGLSWRGAFMVFLALAVVVSIVGIICIMGVKIDFSQVETAKAPDKSETAEEKSYKFTPAENKCMMSLALLYIGYMGVGIALSVWLPMLLANKGFSGVEASLPVTVGTVAQIIAYLFLPTLFAKALKSSKITPAVASGMIVVVLGIMAVNNIYIICVARAALAIIMSFITMHVQSDMALVAPLKAAGRFSSFILAAANAGAVIAVLLIGYLSDIMQMGMLLVFAVLAVAGAVMYIKPSKEIIEEKEAIA